MKRLIFGAIALTLAIGMWAVPARREPFTVTLPDGDSITLRMHGDEHFHYRTTMDGYLVVEHNGYFYYGKQKANGQQVRYLKKAHDENRRTVKEQKWLLKKGVKSVVKPEKQKE